MSSSENRNESYLKLTSTHELGEKQEAVLRVLHTYGSLTDKGIVLFTGLSLSCVNGRRNELVDRGIVAEVGKVFDNDAKRNVTVWSVIYDDMQSTQNSSSCLTNSEMKQVEKYIVKINCNGNEYQKNLARGWLK
jgi:hypothetical protein